jgi:hypothetical protein
MLTLLVHLVPLSLYSHWCRHRSAQQCEQRVPGPRRGYFFGTMIKLDFLKYIKYQKHCLQHILDKSGYFFSFADAFFA